MIKAKHNKYPRLIFNIYLDRILKKNFSHFFIVNRIPDLPEDKAVLVTPNHISWWDGFFIDYINRYHLNRKIYLMMLEEQLKIYKYFKMLGAYSVNPGHKKDVLQSLEYTCNLLSVKENLVVLYPEGVLKPFDTNPGPLQKGLLKITQDRSTPFAVITIAFKISFYNEKQPEIYAGFGPVISSDSVKNNFSDYENLFKENIKSVHDASLKRSYFKDLFK